MRRGAPRGVLGPPRGAFAAFREARAGRASIVFPGGLSHSDATGTVAGGCGPG